MALLFLMLLAFLVLVQTPFAYPNSPPCRCLSTDGTCWPNSQAWSIFNSSLHGQLVVVRPPAWPCHDPHYDEQTCRVAMEKWGDSFWRTDQSGAMSADNWEMDDDSGMDRACFINSNRSLACYQGDVPVYAVNVTEVFQVQLAVKFASKYNLRLVIRNTGHDYLGRSTAKGALSIWLHHLKNMTFYADDFAPKDCEGCPKTSAVTVGAGVQWEELYQASHRNKRVIVGAGSAGCASVGAAGGYPQGGGHSPISPTFGLAADNILEFNVVTANGKLRTANSCQNKDLFWALRGGGGGTYGIVVSATHRTHPAFSGLIFAGFNITANDTSSMQKLLVLFTELNPSLSDAGWSGYFIPLRLNLIVAYILPNSNTTVAKKSLQPLLDYINQQEANGLHVEGGLLPFSSFEEWRLRVLCAGQSSCRNLNGTEGVPVGLASRLIPRDSLVSSSKQLAEAFSNITDLQIPVIGALVAGGKVSQHQDNAVNPAWRKAVWLVIMSVTWNDNATRTEREDALGLVTAANKYLRDITPGSGSYMNEADYNEPDYKYSFYGNNYNRLYAIKQKLDPKGLFVCHHCVGSENWSKDLNCKVA